MGPVPEGQVEQFAEYTDVMPNEAERAQSDEAPVDSGEAELPSKAGGDAGQAG